MKSSSDLIGSKYYSEQNYVLVDMDEISGIFDGGDDSVIHHVINSHESFHSLTRHCGDTINMVNNSGKTIRNLFFKKPNEADVNKAVKTQIANSILIENSSPLQEAFAVFAMDSTYDNRYPDDEKKMYQEKNISVKELEERLEHITEFKNHVKEEILKDDKIKKNYEKIDWLKKVFGNEVIPLYVVCFALNIRFNEDIDDIISKNPATDAQFRFDSAISAIETLHDKKELYKIPRVLDKSPNSMESSKEQVKFEYVMGNDLTGLASGIIDLIEKGIPEYVKNIQYNPLNKKKLATKSMFEKYNLEKTINNHTVNILLKQSEFHIWSGYKISNATLLVPNTKFVPDNILHFWIGNFFYWTMKECIFAKYDIEKRLEEIPILYDVIDKKTLDNVKTLQQSIELEKAEDYDLLIS